MSSLRFPTPALHGVLAAVVLAGPLAGAACNAQLATVLSADGGPDSAGTSSGGAACAIDNDCYADPTISSSRGKCVSGKCVCDPGIATTADGKCGDPISTTDASTLTQCEAKGGKCIPDGSSPPPTYQPDKNGLACDGTKGTTCWVPVAATGAPVCYNDPGCNEDPSVSALLGKCSFGICVCNNGYLQPSGKCGGTPPPECTKQAGTCRQMPATCSAGELESESSTNMSCGDFVEAVCCLPSGACKGGGREVAGAGWVPVDFYCCNASKVQSPAICVNGWKTCRPNETATSNPGGGC